MKEDTSQERFATLVRELQAEHEKVDTLKREIARRSLAPAPDAHDMDDFGQALAELEQPDAMRSHAPAPPLAVRA